MKNLINQNIFSNFVYKTNFSFDYENIEPICNILLLEHTKFPKEDIHVNSYSSYHSKLQPHKQKQFKSFYEFITPIYLNLILNEWGYPRNLNYEIGNSWINTYEKDGYITNHNHNYVICVISAYILHEKNAGNLLFQDPYFTFKKNFLPQMDDTLLYSSVEINKNDVVFFQGGMVHKSEPNKSNYQRMVLTSNVVVKKEMNII